MNLRKILRKVNSPFIMFCSQLINLLKVRYEKVAIKKSKKLRVFSGESQKAQNLRIVFLTGKNFLYQTKYCIESLLCNNCDTLFEFVIIDDGTLSKGVVEELKIEQADIKIIWNNELESLIYNDSELQKCKYLINRRKFYPHLRKIIDVKLVNNAYNIVFDSDMLCFNRCTEILELNKRQTSFAMLDCKTTYGFDLKTIREQLNSDLIEKINVGIVGYNHKNISWEQLENWALNLEQNYQSYVLEQCLYAMLLSKENDFQFLSSDYKVYCSFFARPRNNVCIAHFVSNSKWKLFQLQSKAFRIEKNMKRA